MSQKPGGIRVTALRYHTFNGRPFEEGDVYEVAGDSIQSAAQYFETLKANRMAEVAPDEEPELQGDEPKPKAPAKVPAKTFEHRKPSKDVPTHKK